MDAHLAMLVVKEQFVLLFGKFLRAATGSDNDSKAAKFFNRQLSRVKSGTGESLTGGRDCEWKHARDVPAFFLVHPGKFVEADHFTGNLYVEFAGIETRDAANAASPFEDSVGECRSSDAIRADYAHAGNDDSSLLVH